MLIISKPLFYSISDGAHQYIAIPLSMTSGSPNKITASSPSGSSPNEKNDTNNYGIKISSKDIKIKTEIND